MVVIVVYIMYSVLEGFVLMWFLKMTVVMLLILIMSPGVVVGDGFSVTFENPNPCALRGSSVEFRCSYEYPDGEVVNKTSWSKGATKDGRWTRTELSSLPSYQSRVEYLGDQQHNCSLAIYDLQDNDTGYYYFRFDTHDYGWRSKGSVYLSLAEPTASVYPESVRAGGNVTLTCKTSCTLPATIVWFRDGQPVDKAEFQARAEDAGNYSCAVEGQESVRSDPVALDVLYPPVSVLVEASAPGSLAEGSSVNLSCSSAANPAADSYTWFRRTGSPGSSSLLQVGSGQMLSLPSLEPCHTGHYLCQARNPLGENNSTELLLLVEMTEKPTASVYPESVRAGGNVTLTCKTSCTLPATIVWFRDGQPVDKAEFQARAEDAGNYSCAVEGQESVRSDPVALDVLYPPVSVLVEASAPGSLAEGSSVNLSCSSAANPAADSYTWFRRTGSHGSSSLLQVGSGQMLSLPSLEPSHTGHYLCQARNPLGENNSTELLLLVEMTETDRLIILVGIGVKVFAVLVLPVVMAWAWRKDSAADKEESSPTYESISGSKCYGQDSRVIEEETTV
uniref:B-cell receptor CD22-like isoform X1 n=1 Tax=Centroberyx gerrardi TaxID=166262 RepID=UPI003AAF1405